MITRIEYERHLDRQMDSVVDHDGHEHRLAATWCRQGDIWASECEVCTADPTDLIDPEEDELHVEPAAVHAIVAAYHQHGIAGPTEREEFVGRVVEIAHELHLSGGDVARIFPIACCEILWTGAPGEVQDLLMDAASVVATLTAP